LVFGFGVALSLLWWWTDLLHCPTCSECPDWYCFYADGIYRAVLTRDISGLFSWLPTYAHAQNPLVPLMTAALRLVIGDTILSFVTLSIMATLGTFWLLNRMLRVWVGVEKRARMLLGLAFLGHVIVIARMANPSTDAAGMLMAIACLDAIYRYFLAPGLRTGLLLCLMMLLALMTRIALAPLLAVAPAFLLIHRAGMSIRQWLGGIIFGNVAPAALFFSGLWAVGLLPTLKIMSQKHHLPEFMAGQSFAFFKQNFLMWAQGLGLFAVFNRRWRNPAFTLHLLWLGLYLGMLVVYSGQFFYRYFLPLAPSLVFLAAPAISRMTASAPRLSHAVVYLMVLGNVAYAASVQDWRLFRGAYADWRNGITPTQIPSSLAPIPSTKWRAVVSNLQGVAREAFDGNPATRWTSGEAQRPGQFFEVDLGQDTCVAAVELLPGPFSSDYSRQLRVEVSLDEVRWIQVKDMSGMQVRLLRALYSHADPRIDLVFLPRLARYVRLTQTGSDPFTWWSIAEMQVFADAPDHCRPVAGVTLTSNLLSPQPVTTPILWTAVSKGGTAPEFRFWVQPQGGPFTLAQDYGPNATFLWIPTQQGAYVICVWARSSGSSADNEADLCQAFQVTTPVTSVTLTSTPPSPQPVTTPILWTAVATGGTAPEFRFWVQPQGSPFTLAQDYSPSNSFIWTPTVAGDYVVIVWARSSGSSMAFEKDAVAAFWVTPAGTP